MQLCTGSHAARAKQIVSFRLDHLFRMENFVEPFRR